MTAAGNAMADDMADDMAEKNSGAGITLDEYTEILQEIEEQPAWRSIADREMDYADGNQLDSELLRKQAERGIPPAIEDMIGPALLALQGYEERTRTDWRVTPDGSDDAEELAEAITYRLHKAEKKSQADRACSQAFRSQIAVGIGWVEVRRESDPFRYPYRCASVHRNEIHWDMKSREPDLSDARWLRRQRWVHPRRLALVFPEHKDMIMSLLTEDGRAVAWADSDYVSTDGGVSTGLRNAWGHERPWTRLEDYWYNPTTKEVCVAELWYRQWERVIVLRMPDGRVVEYDEKNLAHAIAVTSGAAVPETAVVAKMYRSYWIGPKKIHDGPSPYPHRHFPYVPFWGFREDNTGIPYGYVRGMKYAQDSLNTGQSKLRWGMTVTRVERTKGAVAMTDEQLRRQVARPDADIVLDADHMARPGARFNVIRDYQLSEQHYRMLEDNRRAIERVSNITAGFMGRQGSATSGLQEQTQVEQTNQGLGHIMGNFRSARTMVGELLMSMIIHDMGSRQETIVIKGDALKDDKIIVVNRPEVDPDTGIKYLSNDVQRTRLKVALEDVPTTSSYRAQQLAAMSEAVKSLPAEYQAAVMPFMVSLMDVPYKRDVIEAIKQVRKTPTPEEIEQQTQQAVQEALAKANHDLKLRELELKERKAESEIKELDAKAVQIGVQAAFAAMQAGAQVAQMPQIAPVADAVMQGAGYRRPSPEGDDPNFPTPDQPGQQPVDAGSSVQLDTGEMPAQGAGMEQGQLQGDARKNTSPIFPPVPEQPAAGMDGIETPDVSDNLPE